MRRLNRKLVSFFAAFVFAVAIPGIASAASMSSTVDSAHGEPPTAGTMLADTFMVRPLTLAGTVVGAVTYVITLPFSALGGNVGEAGKILVADPFMYTFVRPLGQF
jgi:hypothetical protein